MGKNKSEYRIYSEGNLPTLNNVSKILGYFPGVSIVIGVTRIAFNLFSENPSKNHQIVRGVLEILTIRTPLLLVVDLAVFLLKRELQNDLSALESKNRPMIELSLVIFQF
ncbi:MAG: hypothetical protein H0T62_11260 [Parachlamydiaceae bacterium]|nr:hypothetical protein [Parachlamydiaceae bacterium]